MSVKFVNSTTVQVNITEGSGGVYFIKSFIYPGKTFLLKIDRNATYREYLLTTEPEKLPVGSPLTSDDIAEYSKIEIKETEGIRCCPVWIGIPTEKSLGKTFMMLVHRLFRIQPVALPIVNRLENQHVKIVVKNTVSVADRTIADLAPAAQFSLSMDPDVKYHLEWSSVSGELTPVPQVHAGYSEEWPPRDWVSSGDLTKLSKIKIINTSKKYYWEGTFKTHYERYHTHHSGFTGVLARIFGGSR